MDDDVLVIETSWPATTIVTYLEFPLSSGHALAQGRPYANRYANR